MRSTKGNNDDDSNIGGEKPTVVEAEPVYRSAATQMSSRSVIVPPNTDFGSLLPKVPTFSTAECKKWCVLEAQPKPFFPLERVVEIPDDSQTVSLRICDSLRVRSVQAEFEGSQANCKTSGFLSYVINLYAGPHGSTIVEVMRQKGCGFAFRKEREAIITAAKGHGGDVPSKLPSIMKIPDDLLKQYQPPTKKDHEDTLDRASEQLHSKRRDVLLFALQNLSAMTTHDKVNQKSAQDLAHLIMTSPIDIRDTIAQVLITCSHEDDSTSEQILNACLTIFSNSMTLLSNGDTLQSTLDEEKMFTNTMIPSLVNIVSNLSCPHNACLALLCLRLMLKNSIDARNKMTAEAHSIVKNAELFGNQRHMKMAKEAKIALDELKCQ
jgi:hypothetical protein